MPQHPIALLIAAMIALTPSAPLLAQDAAAVQQTIPAPKRAPDEAAYVAKLDELLAPLLKLEFDKAELDRVKAAIEAVKTNNMTKHADVTAAMSDVTAKKFATWARLRVGYGEAAEYRAFLDANPLWADRAMMVQRMEEALFIQGGTAAQIKSYFNGKDPETGIGYAALGSAHLAAGDKDTARKHAQKAWRELNVPASLETGFLRRFGELLTEADHKWRFDRFVTDDVRWANNRADRSAFAKRLIPLLSPTEQKKATARLAVFNKAANATALMAALPADEKDVGLAFHRAQLLRKAGKIDEAAKIILAIPPDPDKIADIDEWWAERRQLAFGALKTGKPKLAYSLVKDAGPLSVNPLKEQTFMAGWIAWRSLKDDASADKHFTDFAKAADGPLSRAKAAYWQGRLAESRKDDAAAKKHYQSAAQNNDTFHGLLATEKLSPGDKKLKITPPAMPSAAEVAAFVNSDAAKAIVMAKKAGLPREWNRGFMTSLRVGLKSEAAAAMVSHLADRLGDAQMSVRVAKAAIAKGQNLITYGYPVHTFPEFKTLRKPPELPFMLGITRQETEFEPTTVSAAGAKGLMQVMTITAQHVCRDYKIKCEIPRLLTDTSYNVSIASAYIADRMGEFGGSYVLGLAGYNAGPGRARQWVRENGDPRSEKIDPVDWIERIPITETREYVAKVLSNIQIYRARLGDDATALRLTEDLMRARGSTTTPAAAQDDVAPTPDNSEG